MHCTVLLVTILTSFRYLGYKFNSIDIQFIPATDSLLLKY